jgi:hypothetical protein
MEKTLKEETVHAVSEMDSLLNRIRGMFLGVECTLKKALTTAEKEKERTYSEILATSSTQANLQKQVPSAAQPSDRPPQIVGLIVRGADTKTSSNETKRLITEAVDPRALKLGVSKFKNLANNALLVHCKSKTDRDVLEKELRKLSTVTVERPKRKIPTLPHMFVPKEIEDEAIKDSILQ